MADDSQSLKKTNTTFRFASGQVLTLDKDQVAKVPYLAAMVSSADRFESVRGEDGYCKLDPNIDYQHFSFALRSLSFCSVRQLLINLPVEEHVIPIVALLDFLGLIIHPLPTLSEVDSTFFSSVVYSPYCKKHLRIVKHDILQDMAVRFTIAIIKEEYDFHQGQVMDQIYWFAMFILSAPKWFGPRLRHHVYTTVKNCFAVFKPSLLKPLKELTRTSKRESSRYSSISSDECSHLDEDDTYSYLSSPITFFSGQDEDFDVQWFPFSSFERPNKRFIRSIYEQEEWFLCTEQSRHRDPLKIIEDRVLEKMYMQLQSKLYHHGRAILQQQRYSYDIMQVELDLERPLSSFKSELLSKKMDEIFKTENVQEEIDALILQDLCYLTPKLEHEYAKLVQAAEDEERYNRWDELRMLFSFEWFVDHPAREIKRERTSRYSLLLYKLHKDQYSIVEEVRKRVLDRLNQVTLSVFSQWEWTRLRIGILKSEYDSYEQSDASFHIKKKTNKCQQYEPCARKPLLNHRFKYSAR